MGTYILIFGFSNIVAGGPIYYCNKIKYLKDKGWDINVLPINSGEIYIKPLEQYSKISFPFIVFPPYIFSKKEIERKIDIMLEHITVSDEIVIETGTDFTALWGELLAKRLNAKHIVVFLDEKNKRLNKYTSDFYKFKCERNELACISYEALMCNFGAYFEIENPKEHILTTPCSNSVANVCNNFLDVIPAGDYKIGSIGRLDKTMVPMMIDSICEFACKFPNKKISLCLFGGADENSIKKIKEKLNLYQNIEYYISGYIWPIPQAIFSEFDVFISTAGSAKVSANQNIPTIYIDAVLNTVEGILINLTDYSTFRLDLENPTICDYLIDILINKKVYLIQGRVSLEYEWKQICSVFDKHIEFYNNSATSKKYFPTEKLWDGSIKNLLKRILFNYIDSNKYYSNKK